MCTLSVSKMYGGLLVIAAFNMETEISQDGERKGSFAKLPLCHVTVPGVSDIISGVCVVCNVASVRVMEQLSGHFTTNCCGCPDRGLMIRRWIKIILMSLLIRKNSK